MGLTQNYYNWIKAVKFGIGTGRYAVWSDMPDSLKVKDTNGNLYQPKIHNHYSNNDYGYYNPFENIKTFSGWSSFPYGYQNIIPSNNEDAESIDDYIISQNFVTNYFEAVGTEPIKVADWENDVAAVKVRYLNTSSAAQTVYGLEFIGNGIKLDETSSTNAKRILFYRKKFDTPIVVQPGEIIELSLTWEVA